MSKDQDDWENSAAAQRRKIFFEATPSGSSRLSDPPKDIVLPKRPCRPQTPHPRAGAPGLDSQQQREINGSSSRDPYRSVNEERQPDDEYGGGRAPVSYDEGSQDHRRRESQSRPTTRRSLSRDGFGGTLEEQFTEQYDIGSGEASSHTEKGKSAMSSRPRKPSGGSGSAKKVTIRLSDEVRYPKHHSPGSSPDSTPDSRQGERLREPSSGRADTCQREGQVGQLEYEQTRAGDLQARETSKADERRTHDGRREIHERDIRDKDTVRHREQREADYSDERSSHESDRRSGGRRRRNDDRSSGERRRRSDERSEGRQRRDDSAERRREERRIRRNRTSRESGQGSDRSGHYGQRRERSTTPPGKIEKLKNYFSRSK